MPIIYQNKELTLFNAKTADKHVEAIDGFYQDTDGRRFFIKKPEDKGELFAELFAGLILQEFMRRELIDPVYYSSLLVADVIRCEDESYGLIQPMIDFEVLHKIIGTSYANGGDRNTTKETLYGPQYYSALTQQQHYFGLSIALMFSLLLGAHSVHSGNVVALNNDNLVSRQYGRLDWGDAFRYFAHPDNNDNLLYAYENTGFFNYKKVTKNYFLNYKLIPGLFPAMADKAKSLIQSLEENTLLDIVIQALKRIPVDLIGKEIKEKFALYICMDSFKNVILGTESDGGQFAMDMAKILKMRLEKITQLQDLTQAPEQEVYKSIYLTSPVKLSFPLELSFPQLLERWNTQLLENKKATSLELDGINLSQLASYFNEYLKQLATQSDQANIWNRDKSSANLFVPFNKKMDRLALHGHAFIDQYKESVVFLHMFSLDPKTTGSLRFAPYEHPIQEYVKQYPDSAWSKLQQLATESHGVIQTIRLIQNGQNFGLEGVMEDNMPILIQHLQQFMRLKSEVEHTLKPSLEVKPFSQSSFYPIDDIALNEMSGEQLVTICLEELDAALPSLLVTRILKNELLWSKLNKALDSNAFDGRQDNFSEKRTKILEWYQLLQNAAMLHEQIKDEYTQELIDENGCYKEQVILLQKEVSQLTALNNTQGSEVLELKKALDNVLLIQVPQLTLRAKNAEQICDETRQEKERISLTVAQKTQEIRELTDHIQNYKEKQQQAQAKVEQLTNQLQKVNEENFRNQDQLELLNTQVSQLELLKEQSRVTEQKLTQASKELAELMLRAQNSERISDEERQEKEKHNQTIKDQIETIQKITEHLLRSEEKHLEMQTQVLQLTKQLQKVNHEYTHYKDQVILLNSQVAQLQLLKEELRKTDLELNTTRKQVTALTLDVEDAKRNIKEEQQEHEKKSQTLKEKMDELLILTEQLRISREQNLKAMTQLQQWQLQNADLEKQLQGQCEALVAAKKLYEQRLKEKSELQFARTLKVAPVLLQLENMRKKAQDLTDRKEEVATIAKKLIKKIDNEIQSYIHSDHDEKTALSTFQERSKGFIEKAEQPLGEHREEWKYVLANLSLAILSLGVGYLIASLINKGINDRYTFFSVTQSREHLNELKNSTMTLSY